VRQTKLASSLVNFWAYNKTVFDLILFLKTAKTLLICSLYAYPRTSLSVSRKLLSISYHRNVSSDGWTVVRHIWSTASPISNDIDRSTQNLQQLYIGLLGHVFMNEKLKEITAVQTLFKCRVVDGRLELAPAKANRVVAFVSNSFPAETVQHLLYTASPPTHNRIADRCVLEKNHWNRQTAH